MSITPSPIQHVIRKVVSPEALVVVAAAAPLPAAPVVIAAAPAVIAGGALAGVYVSYKLFQYLSGGDGGGGSGGGSYDSSAGNPTGGDSSSSGGHDGKGNGASKRSLKAFFEKAEADPSFRRKIATHRGPRSHGNIFGGNPDRWDYRLDWSYATETSFTMHMQRNGDPHQGKLFQLEVPRGMEWEEIVKLMKDKLAKNGYL